MSKFSVTIENFNYLVLSTGYVERLLHNLNYEAINTKHIEGYKTYIPIFNKTKNWLTKRIVYFGSSDSSEDFVVEGNQELYDKLSKIIKPNNEYLRSYIVLKGKKSGLNFFDMIEAINQCEDFRYCGCLNMDTLYKIQYIQSEDIRVCIASFDTESG